MTVPSSAGRGLSPIGRWYVGAVSVLGLSLLGVAIFQLTEGAIDRGWLWLALLTVLSASVTIKVPAVPARITVSETFVFTALLVFGPWAGVLTVALDGLVASMWSSRRGKHELYRTLFNMTAPACALWVAAEVCLGLSGIRPVVERVAPLQELMAALFLLATLYFILNSWLMAFAISFERSVSAMSVWRANFLWLAISYFGGASVSVLLVLLFNSSLVSSVAIGIVVPLLTFFYLTIRIAMGRSEDTINHLIERNEAAEARARLEAELREAHRLESVGRLAAGIADDFDHLITPIAGAVGNLLRETAPDEPHYLELQRIQQSAERARLLTQQLMVFGRNPDPAMTQVNLKNLVIDFEHLLRRTVRKDIHVESQLPESIGPIQADGDQLEQVLMNLAINAEDAMPNGGTLTIGLAETKVYGEKESKPHGGLQPGSYVTLSVGDTGTGSDNVAIQQLADPALSTQGRSEGRGLGLWTVYRIAKQHGGHLTVESAPGKGNTIVVHLPQQSVASPGPH